MQRVGGEFGRVQGKKESQYVWSVMISVGQWNEIRLGRWAGPEHSGLCRQGV